jgi:dsDNA-binding SOS-regulon protein
MPLFYQSPTQPPTVPQTPALSASQTVPKPYLTEAQVAEKCKNIPVFVLMDTTGAPLTATLPGKKPTVGVFLGKKEADDYYKQLPKANKELVSQVRMNILTLSDVLLRAKKDSRDAYALVSQSASVKEAQNTLVAQGKKATDLKGVPLFIVRRADTGDGKGNASTSLAYVTIRVGNDIQVPCFFTKKDADNLVRKFLDQDRKVKLAVEVGTLENILHLLETSPSPQIQQLTLFPSAEMLAQVPLPPPAPELPPASQPPF